MGTTATHEPAQDRLIREWHQLRTGFWFVDTCDHQRLPNGFETPDAVVRILVGRYVHFTRTLQQVCHLACASKASYGYLPVQQSLSRFNNVVDEGADSAAAKIHGPARNPCIRGAKGPRTDRPGGAHKEELQAVNPPVCYS